MEDDDDGLIQGQVQAEYHCGVFHYSRKDIRGSSRSLTREVQLDFVDEGDEEDELVRPVPGATRKSSAVAPALACWAPSSSSTVAVNLLCSRIITRSVTTMRRIEDLLELLVPGSRAKLGTLPCGRW